MSWDQIKGHDHLIEAFDRAWQRGRLAHAYLFVGPPGVGKRLFAGELAKALLCETQKDGKLAACDQCVSCILFAAGTHPDFFTVRMVEEANEIKIDQLRELCSSFNLKPARGRGKIGILDDADDMNESAANCFLKTLEEPPPRSVFILVGTRLDGQRPTVVSRCQVIRFAPLAENQVIEVLKKEEVDGKVPLLQVARLSNGSPGQALALADPALWEFRGTLLEGISLPRPDTVGLAKKWIEFAEDAGKELAPQRRRAALVLRLLIEFLHDALAMASDGKPRTDDAGDLKLLRDFTARADATTILKMLDRCLEAEFHIDRYVQLVLVLEGLVDALGQQLSGTVAAAR